MTYNKDVMRHSAAWGMEESEAGLSVLSEI